MGSHRRFSSLGMCMGALLFVGLNASSVRAETSDTTAAEALFRSGKEYLGLKDYARACPMFADSFRADPATGTLLALAICFEGQGKLASAYRSYAEVVTRSRRESRPDRERAARAKMAMLDPQVSWLTISLSAEAREIEGIEVKRNGVVVSNVSLDKSVPVDSGPQVIEVTAPRHDVWRTTFIVNQTQETKTVTVPALTEVEEAAPPPPVASERPAPSAPKEEPKPIAIELPSSPQTATAISALQGAGIATIIAGVAGIGTGSFFALHAISRNKASQDGCAKGNVCTPQGTQDRWDARDAGNTATVAFVAGGVLTLAGTAMVLFGKPARVGSACSGTICFQAYPVANANAAGGVLSGSF